MLEYGKCALCKEGDYQLLRKDIVSGDTYIVLKCDKCHHQIARSER